jgi:hypothetical protein
MSLIPRISKYSGWLLFLLIALYVVTGFAYAGYFGLDVFIPMGTATLVHSSLELAILLIVLTFLHCCLRISVRFFSRFKEKSPEQNTLAGSGLQQGQSPAGQPVKE